jgi:hypothetical protein
MFLFIFFAYLLVLAAIPTVLLISLSLLKHTDQFTTNTKNLQEKNSPFIQLQTQH